MSLTNKPSPFATRLIKILLLFNGARHIYNSAKLTNWFIDSRGIINALPFRVPKGLTKDWEQQLIADTTCFTKAGKNDQTIFFLHGGGYNQRPTLFHFLFLDEIHKLTGAHIIFPLYPLAPNYTYDVAYRRVNAIYDETRILAKGHCVTLMGDSAGGGLSLGLYMQLAENNKLLPDKLVLIAPCLDVTMTNPEIKPIEKHDRMLGRVGLVEMGKRWAGKANLTDYRISPIYGDISLIDKLMLIVGNHDILFPDAEKLVKKLRELNKPVEFIIGEKMPHDYPLMPIPEARQAIEEISNYILHGACRIKTINESL